MGKIKRIFKLVILITIIGSFSSTTQAQELTVVGSNFGESEGSVVVADVGVYDIRVTEENDRNFVISFSIANNSNVVESQVRYAAELNAVKEDEDGSMNNTIVDSFVYDEVISINPGETIDKNVEYRAPASFSGEYYLGISSRKDSRLPLATNQGERIILKETNEGISINKETCKLIVNDNEVFPLIVGVDINKDNESLKISCNLINKTSEAKKFIPRFETTERTKYGRFVSRNDLTEEEILAGEDKNFTFDVPLVDRPQAYSTIFSLYNNEDKISNSVDVHYVIQGNSGTIDNFQLDKDQYKEGEQMKLSFLFSGRADSFPESRALGERSPEAQSFVYNVKIENGEGELCAEKNEITVENQSNNLITTSLKSLTDCKNPNISVFLYDGNGELLDQRTFAVETKITPSESKQSVDNAYRTKFINILMIIFTIPIVIVILYLIIKKRKGINIFIFILFAGTLLTISNNNAEALTVSMIDNTGTLTSYATYTLASRSFTTCGSNAVNVTIANDINVCSNAGTFQMDSLARGTTAGSLSLTCTDTANCNNSATRSIRIDNSSTGTRNVSVQSHLYKPNPSSSFYAGTWGTGNISYSVNNCAINAGCGTRARNYTYNTTSWPSGSSWCSPTFLSGINLPSFPNQGQTVSWTCLGQNGGSNRVCRASRDAQPINGSCGSRNAQRNGNYTGAETAYPSGSRWCRTGSPVNPSPSWRYPAQGQTVSWQCRGSGGGTTASCSAVRGIVVNGSCGSRNAQKNGNYTGAETAYPSGSWWCRTGSPVNPSPSWSFPAQGQTVSWQCRGSGGGSTSSCRAIRANPVAIPTVTLTANPSSVKRFITGENTSTLTWSATSADWCWSSGDWAETWRNNINGTDIVTPISNSTYTIRCGNSSGEITTSANVTVCGDGTIDSPGEACDDGNNIETDSCTNACISNCVPTNRYTCVGSNNETTSDCTSSDCSPSCSAGETCSGTITTTSQNSCLDSCNNPVDISFCTNSCENIDTSSCSCQNDQGVNITNWIEVPAN